MSLDSERQACPEGKPEPRKRPEERPEPRRCPEGGPEPRRRPSYGLRPRRARARFLKAVIPSLFVVFLIILGALVFWRVSQAKKKDKDTEALGLVIRETAPSFSLALPQESPEPLPQESRETLPQESREALPQESPEQTTEETP